MGISSLIIIGGQDYRVAGKEKKGVGPVSYATVASLQLMGTKYRGADKSLARPGRKQSTATEDFDFHIS